MERFRFSWLLVLVILLAVAAAPISAATFISSEGDVTIDQESNDDLYAAGNLVQVKAAVTGDAFVFGRQTTIAAPVSADLYTAGQMVLVQATTGDDLHAAGENVTVEADVVGDVFVAGSQVTLSEDTTIGKDVYIAGETLVIAGQVGGTVRASGNVVRIASTAVIDGDVKVYSNNAPVIEEGARIDGEIEQVMPPTEDAHESRSTVADWIRGVLTLFVVAALLAYGMPGLTKRTLETLTEQPGTSIGIGVLWLLLFVPATVLLLMTIIGIPLALVVMVGSIVLYIAAAGITALFIGQFIFTRIIRTSTNQAAWSQALLGAVVYEAVQLLDGVGVILVCIAVLFAAGAFLKSIWQSPLFHHEFPDEIKESN